MKAILMHQPGRPEVLQPAEVPAPEISEPNQVLVRLKAAGVNPIDTKLRSRGTYFPDRMPAILGCDGAGVIEAAGDRVSRFRVGDEVYFCNGGIGGDPGTYAEYAVVDHRFIARKPEELDFSHAAAAPLVCITAWEALHDRAQIQHGDRVLIHAGAGGVGHVAVQLARSAKCDVIATVDSEEQARFVRNLGAHEAINHRERDFVDAVMEWSDGEGVDVALDTVGGETFQKTFEAVRPYGDLVTLLQPGANVDWKTARLRNLRITQELMLSPMFFSWRKAQEHQARILEQCAALVGMGKLQIRLNRTFPLEQAAEAHRLLEQGAMQGKLALTID